MYMIFNATREILIWFKQFQQLTVIIYFIHKDKINVVYKIAQAC